ncbi:MAG: hypothetical protein WKG01_13210 [Kofleriaceae bacterium]
MIKINATVLLASLLAFAACKKSDKTDGAKGASPKAATGDLPKLTEDPEPAAITPSETTPPLESAKFRMLAKRSKSGWPEFDVYNLNTKPIAFLAIYGYAYDKDGKQLARTPVPLSWNGNVPPGDKSSWAITFSDNVALPAGATSFQLCYTDIKFKDEAKSTQDEAKCPDQRPKS